MLEGVPDPRGGGDSCWESLADVEAGLEKPELFEGGGGIGCRGGREAPPRYRGQPGWGLQAGALRAARGVSPPSGGGGPPGQGAEGGAEALGLRLALASVVLEDPCAQGSPRGHSGPWSPGDCNPGAPHLSARLPLDPGPDLLALAPG